MDHRRQLNPEEWRFGQGKANTPKHDANQFHVHGGFAVYGCVLSYKVHSEPLIRNQLEQRTATSCRSQARTLLLWKLCLRRGPDLIYRLLMLYFDKPRELLPGKFTIHVLGMPSQDTIIRSEMTTKRWKRHLSR